jgi:hypothetical protein
MTDEIQMVKNDVTCKPNEETNGIVDRTLEAEGATKDEAITELLGQILERQDVTRQVKCHTLSCENESRRCWIGITEEEYKAKIEPLVSCRLLVNGGNRIWKCKYTLPDNPQPEDNVVKIKTFCECSGVPVH